jgi:hypothetical protein
MSNKRPIESDTSLPATIFHHYFQKRPETEKEYIQLLKQLKGRGIFLMDILDEPIRIREKDGINKKNLKILIKEIPKLRKRMESRGIQIKDENIIFLLPRTHYKKDLKQEFPNSRFIRWEDFRLSPE